MVINRETTDMRKDLTALERYFDTLGLRGCLVLGADLWTPPSGHIFAMLILQLETLEA